MMRWLALLYLTCTPPPSRSPSTTFTLVSVALVPRAPLADDSLPIVSVKRFMLS